MRSFLEIMEARGDTAVFTFGRFNPPTTGHEKLIMALAKQQSKNAGSIMYVYPSHSQSPKKDPIPHAKKIAYMRKMFPKYARNITVSKARTTIEVAVELYNKGHKAIVMVVGSDRVAEFDRLLNEYNGVTGKRHGYYGFDNIEVVSAGERDPDSEGVEGMSASKMRAAASSGDFDSFKTGLPSGFKDGLKLYNDVRKNMGIREERDMGEMSDFETLRDMYLTGKIWNVGDIVEAHGNEGKVIRKGTNYLTFVSEDGKVHKTWLHDIVERDYRKEYDNYQGQPEQIARRSSRNKARRIMGNKIVDGMDVGHKDNDPMNNDPSNLKNEDPSDNRREPRLREVKQDKDIKDKEGTQPAKYYAGDMAKSTKDKRDAHFKAKKSGPAPGDSGAETKPSTHTKKFKQMYGEVKDHKTDYETFVKMYSPLNKSVDDASAKLKKITSKNRGAMGLTDPKVKASPEFKKAKAEYEKSFDLTKKFLKGVPKDFLKKNAQSRRLRREEVELDEKRAKKAVAGGKVQKLVTAHGYSFKGKNYKEIDMELVKIDNSSQMVTFNIIHPAEIFGNEMKIPFKNLRRGRYMATDTSKINNEVLGKDADMGDYIDDFAKSDSPQFKGKSKEKRKEMAIAAYLSKNEEFELNEKIEGLVTKAEKSGMPYGILKKVYDRGMAAYKTGHRPGTTAQQWAFARVNSFVTKSSGTWGKADADLAKQVRGESVKEETPCWSGFKQVGMKTKGGKQVPNCVPEETTTEACCDDCDDLYDHVIAEAEYQGKKVQLNNPIRTSENPNKKFKVYTMGPSGKVVVVRFGDPNMGINRDDPKARAAFRSRHSCDEKKDKTTAGYWSCYQWRASSKVDN